MDLLYLTPNFKEIKRTTAIIVAINGAAELREEESETLLKNEQRKAIKMKRITNRLDTTNPLLLIFILTTSPFYIRSRKKISLYYTKN